MKITKIALGCAALAALGTLTLSAAPSALAQAPYPPFGGRPHIERHPELLRALRSLQRTESDLRHADHDFGGHRIKAADLCLRAEQEIRIAMQYDRD